MSCHSDVDLAFALCRLLVSCLVEGQMVLSSATLKINSRFWQHVFLSFCLLNSAQSKGKLCALIGA